MHIKYLFLFLTVFLVSCAGDQGNYDASIHGASSCGNFREQDARYYYYCGMGADKTKFAAMKAARQDAEEQARGFFGTIGSFSTVSRATLATQDILISQDTRSFNNVELKEFQQVRTFPVFCRHGVCEAAILFKYPKAQYEKEKQRLKDAASKEDENVVTIGQKTRYTTEVFFVIKSKASKGFSRADLRDVTFEVNGNKYGASPTMRFYLEAGCHDIYFDHPRYDVTYAKEVCLSRKDMKKPVFVKPVWKEVFGKIEVSSQPGGAEIYIDGKPIGKKTPMWRSYKLTPGRHVLTLKHPDYADYKREFELKKHETKQIKANFSKGGAYFSVLGKPGGVDIHMNGKKLAEKAPFRKFEISERQIDETKDYTFLATKAGYEDFYFTKRIRFNDDVRQEIDLKPLQKKESGVLEENDAILSLPPYAEEMLKSPARRQSAWQTKNTLLSWDALPVLSSSVSHNRKTGMFTVRVRIDPDKYENFFFLPVRKQLETITSYAPLKKKLPLLCVGERGCIVKEGAADGYGYYLRGGKTDYGFWSDSLPVLYFQDFHFYGPTHQVPLFVAVHIVPKKKNVNSCNKKFYFYLSPHREIGYGRVLFDPVLSKKRISDSASVSNVFLLKGPDVKISFAGGMSDLSFPVTNCPFDLKEGIKKITVKLGRK